MVMDAKYKILFSGEFKSWVQKDELVGSNESGGSRLYPSMIQQGKKGRSNLTHTLKLLVNKSDS